MDKQALIVILTILSIIAGIEFIVLMFVVFFANMSFLLFLFTLFLRIASFFLLGFSTLFLIFTLMGLQPKLTLEWWIMHLKDHTRFFGSVFVSSTVAIVVSVLLGAALALLTERFFLFSFMERLHQWVLTNLK